MDTETPNAVDIRLSRALAAGAPRDLIAAEYTALRNDAVWIDRRARARTLFSGAKAADVLTGLVTNDVLALTPGHGQYAAALTPKSKILADIRIFARADGLLVDTSWRAAASWWAMIRKYVNPRLAKYVDASETLHDVGFFGPRARTLVAGLTGIPVETLGELTPYAHVTQHVDGTPLMIARVPDAGIEGYDVIGAPGLTEAIANAASARGTSVISPETLEIARIEAGRPEWGLDMDDSTLPQEANLDELQAISYTKGCYTGQETVARVHFRGHVNRNLRGIRFDAGVIPPRGAELIDDTTGRAVGDVRSAVVSPRLGGVALAMLRREVLDDSPLTARWAEGSVPVTVTSLPFDSAG